MKSSDCPQKYSAFRNLWKILAVYGFIYPIIIIMGCFSFIVLFTVVFLQCFLRVTAGFVLHKKCGWAVELQLTSVLCVKCSNVVGPLFWKITETVHVLPLLGASRLGHQAASIGDVSDGGEIAMPMDPSRRTFLPAGGTGRPFISHPFAWWRPDVSAKMGMPVMQTSTAGTHDIL